MPRGKPQSTRTGSGSGKAGILGNIGRAASTFANQRSGANLSSGRSAGLYRVNQYGEMIKVANKKKRKTGYRMPQVIRRQLEASTRLLDQIGTAVVLGVVKQ